MKPLFVDVDRLRPTPTRPRDQCSSAALATRLRRRPGPSTAADTIGRLQADGNRVVVSKVGTGPIEDCTVASVRSVQTRPAPSANPLTDVPNMQTTTTVHVGLNC